MLKLRSFVNFECILTLNFFSCVGFFTVFSVLLTAVFNLLVSVLEIVLRKMSSVFLHELFGMSCISGRNQIWVLKYSRCCRGSSLMDGTSTAM